MNAKKDSSGESGASRAWWFLKTLAGPLLFVLTYSIPIADLPEGGKIALATLVWAATWWVLSPIPWAATSFLPLVIFPLTQTMDITETAQLYGQPIFFWIMGTSLLGHAILKHGLAKRFAIRFLSLPVVGGSTCRLLFFYMLATGLVSMFVSDASTIALMLPLGLSLKASLYALTGSAAAAEGADQALSGEKRTTRLGTFFALGTLYAAVAGGIATIAGAPHNAVAMAQLETLTGRRLDFFTWMMLGIPTFLTTLVLFYLLLLWLYKPEINKIPGVAEYFREERIRLGRIKLGEIHVLLTFLVTVALFTLPPLLPTLLGAGHPATLWVRKTISVWIVPPILMLLLFGLPSDLKKKEFVLHWKEAAARAPWHIMIMVTSAVGITSALEGFGFMKILTAAMQRAELDPGLFPFFAGLITSISTNFIAGIAATSIYVGMLVPVAEQIGFDPAAIAFMIPATAVGVVFPWAGATIATAFGFGEIALKDLIRTGIFAEAILITVAAIYCLTIGSLL